jgi:putative endopeptidase
MKHRISRLAAASTWALVSLISLTPLATHAATNPCADFDEFVNGEWQAKTELPASRARIGSFDTLRVANDKLLEKALAELAADPKLQTTPGLKLLASYYSAGMDLRGIEKRGLVAVQPVLIRIDSLTREQLPALLGDMARLQLNPPLTLGVGPDAKDATKNVLSVQQAGLGLPDRDDYLRKDSGTDANTARVLAAYREHARTLLQAAGVKTDEAVLDTLLAFETQMAQATMTRVQRRDPVAVYNPFSGATLKDLDSSFDWSAWLTAYGLKPEATATAPLVVGQVAHAKAVAALAATTPLETWKNYLRVRVLEATAEFLPQELAKSHFAYRSGAIRGLKEAPSRVEQVILMIGGQYGGAPVSEALGELFVSKAFSPQAQARSQQMLADIKAAMSARIQQLPWMSEPTKLLAKAKLDAMVAKIGGPAKWSTWEGLALQPDDYAGNLLRANAWNSARRLADLGQPVDRTRWNTSPHIVNAFAASGNQIVFPAGILQPPFFDANADDATNFGGIGMVIGHEITHHFDDRGRQFDAVGNLNDWWQPADAAAYKARADRVAALYSSYEPTPGVHINGRLTLGENLSDVGGIQVAYEGLQIALARQRAAGKATPLIDGYTPEQRYFMANALIWRVKTRTEALVDQLRTDGHSPGRYRILGPMSQMQGFAKAFGCKPGDAMVAGDPIVVW